jgi:hypothetical protein
MIQSVAGGLRSGELSRERPFRDPHHSALLPALVGDLKMPAVELLVADRRHNTCRFSGFQDDDDLIGLCSLEVRVDEFVRAGPLAPRQSGRWCEHHVSPVAESAYRS